jgi:hypothetical protein
MRRLLLPLSIYLLAAGCHVTVVDGNNNTTNGEPHSIMGSARVPGYHIAANASTVIPGGDIGFLVTANGQGGFSITWTDTADTAANFAGSLTTDGNFSEVAPCAQCSDDGIVNDQADLIQWSSVPGAALHGFDVATSQDPIYLSLRVDGNASGFGIFFTGAVTGDVIDSAFNPVAFTSP